jgi:hypothetical protein
LDRLKLEAFLSAPFGASTTHVIEAKKLTPEEYRYLADDIHRRFHFVVCRWLQEQGADVVR